MKTFTGRQVAEVRREFAPYEVSKVSELWNYYLQDGYFVINNALRYNIITPRLLSIVDKMLFLMSPLPKDVTIYRGLRFKHEFRVGDSFSDAGFLSTTFDKGLAWGISHDILELSVSEGTPFVFLSSELEVVLPPRCKFIIDEVINDYDDKGHTYTSLRLTAANDRPLIATVAEMPDSDAIKNDIDYLGALDVVYNLSQYDFDVTA